MGHIIAIIPARSGSKSVKDKNIRIMNGKPMMAYSIEQALASKYIERVIVSTDSLKYKEIAEEHGAEVPFLRPASASTDTALDIDVFNHALNWLKEKEGYEVDYCVQLRPTHPIRDSKDIDNMLETLMKHPEADSIRSVSLEPHVPFKMWFYDEESSQISPLVTCDVKEAYNAPRQILPKVYMQNACIDIFKGGTVLEKHSMTGDIILGYKMNYDFDIDTEEDFLRAERYQLLRSVRESGKKLKFCFDIDGVIARKTPENDYKLATPMSDNIEIINHLYDAGHKIVLFTARGFATGIDWKDVTENQMKDWGVKHHELRFGKPDADFYVDDKLVELSLLKEFL